MKILTTAEMRRAEQDSVKAGVSLDQLMENAGLAVAGAVSALAGGVKGLEILLLVGPGNNGGDGLVAARHLHDMGAVVGVWLASARAGDDANLNLVRERDITCLEADDAGVAAWLDSAEVVVDALFGTGKVRSLGGAIGGVLTALAEAGKHRQGLRIVSVDLPSGMNADSGAVDEFTPWADVTLTLGCPKRGLYLYPGAARAGEIMVLDIGIPENLLAGANIELITDDRARALLPPRPVWANKGTFGRVLAVAGSVNYSGAARLAAGGALRAGAGLVTLAAARGLLPMLAAGLPEATYLPLDEAEPGIIGEAALPDIIAELPRCQALLVGCGLGQHQSTAALVRSLLLEHNDVLPPLVVDADGLNLLSGVDGWQQKFSAEAVLTPHPGEMARLTGREVAAVQADRVDICMETAAAWHKVVVLKGAATVVAAPDGRAAICPVANPGLARGGTGDVLAGIIAGLLAQGLPAYEAASLGVHLHAGAGVQASLDMGVTGMLSSDLLLRLPLYIKKLAGK
jgi:ADP-dependent NAD(P)H-hydrate dehydratase / NAD(P)H-hydrate epimerase